MSGEDESILNLLVECPWWVSVLVSGIAFVFLRYIVPSIDFGSKAANSFAKGLSGGAPIVALVLLLLPRSPLSAHGRKGNGANEDELGTGHLQREDHLFRLRL